MSEENARWHPERIARVCHEANRALQLVTGDPAPSQPWDCETEDTRRSAVAGVEAALKGVTPEQLHDEWVTWKAAEGWTYGPEKDPDAKTHPCMVPYDHLPPGQRVKDAVFAAIVGAMSGNAEVSRDQLAAFEEDAEADEIDAEDAPEDDEDERAGASGPRGNSMGNSPRSPWSWKGGYQTVPPVDSYSLTVEPRLEGLL